MKGTVHNRTDFLKKISKQLNRELAEVNVHRQEWNYRPQHEVYKGASQDDLMEVLKKQCKVIHTNLVITSHSELRKNLHTIIHLYNGGPVIRWKDKRFIDWELKTFFDDLLPAEGVAVHEWESSLREENIQLAEQANIGITISDITLAESGTAVLFSSNDHGRTVSFLPSKSIILIPKSSIVARMTQAAQIIREKVTSGGKIASCINFITGPSNSADIEMKLVVGVHGPMEMTYVVIEDL